jgi:predicted ABC-type transport system involved in lysophospholipase L1 biosynthesis ATPase subunit
VTATEPSPDASGAEVAVLRVEALCRDYVMGEEQVHALAGIDLNVARNEYVAIMGPSGRASPRS